MSVSVLWVDSTITAPVPGWVVALAVLAGLLLLALLIFVMYKVRQHILHSDHPLGGDSPLFGKP